MKRVIMFPFIGMLLLTGLFALMLGPRFTLAWARTCKPITA